MQKFTSLKSHTLLYYTCYGIFLLLAFNNNYQTALTVQLWLLPCSWSIRASSRPLMHSLSTYLPAFAWWRLLCSTRRPASNSFLHNVPTIILWQKSQLKVFLNNKDVDICMVYMRWWHITVLVNMIYTQYMYVMCMEIMVHKVVGDNAYTLYLHFYTICIV